MDSVNNEEKENLERISALNIIFEDLVTDASDLVKDLFWGVKNYLFFGLVTLLFGVQEIIYNIEVIQERLYIPLFIGAIMLFAGAVQILNYFRLRSKYSRLFEVQSQLKKAQDEYSLVFPRRKPSIIALELLKCIDQNNGKASKWDLIKILGNESQFQKWVTDFLIKDKFIVEKQESNHSFYVKTSKGEQLHKLVKNGDLLRAFLRLSGKRLRRE